MVNKIKILLLVVLFCSPCIICAQAKPKRDASKDRSVVVGKQKKKVRKSATAEATEKQKQQQEEEEIKRNTQIPQATYLYVDQQTSVSRTIDSYRGTEKFDVKTDGKEWVVSNVPDWCKVTNYSDCFVLSYDSNPNHDERSIWFNVVCDNKVVRVDIKQNGTPLHISSKFNFANLEHNVDGNVHGLYGNKCLKINTNVTIQGAKGQRCLVVAFFSDENYNRIKTSSSFHSYGLQTTNDLYVSTGITPISDNSQNYNVSLYLPSDAMLLAKKNNKVYCQLAVFCEKTSKYISGASYTIFFRAKSRKGKVTTKKW